MNVEDTGRGFARICHPDYTIQPKRAPRLIQESSAVGDYPGSPGKPGSSYLWVGEHHHLNREEVAELVTHMQRWLDTQTLWPQEDSV